MRSSRARGALLFVTLALSACGRLITDGEPPSFADLELTFVLANPSYTPPGTLVASLEWYPGATSSRISQPIAFDLDGFHVDLSIDTLPPEAALNDSVALARIVMFADLDNNGLPTLIGPGTTSLAGTEPVVGSPEDVYLLYVEGSPPGPSDPASGGATGLQRGFNLVQTLAAPPSGCVGAACCELVTRGVVPLSTPERTTVPAGDAASRFLCEMSSAIVPAITGCTAQTWSACDGCVTFPNAATGEPLTCATDGRAYAIAHFASDFDPTLGPICGADESATVQVTSLAAGANAPDGWPCP